MGGIPDMVTMMRNKPKGKQIKTPIDKSKKPVAGGLDGDADAPFPDKDKDFPNGKN